MELSDYARYIDRLARERAGDPVPSPPGRRAIPAMLGVAAVLAVVVGVAWIIAGTRDGQEAPAEKVSADSTTTDPTATDPTTTEMTADSDPSSAPRVEIHPPGSEPLTVHLTQQALITPDQEHTVMHQVGFSIDHYGYDAYLYESDRSPLDPCSQVQPCIEVRPAVPTGSGLLVRSWAPVLIPGGPTPTVATNLTLEGDGWTLAMQARYSGAPIEPFDLLTSAELPGPLGQITFRTQEGEATATAYATMVTAIGPDETPLWQIFLSFGCSPSHDACIDDIGVSSGQIDADAPTIPATELVTAIR